MPCYHPLIAIPTGNLRKNGKQYLRIEKLEKSDDVKKIKESGSYIIPCGHCIGCRLDYSRSWADRMMLELEDTKKAVFLTLTYNNENLTILTDNETGVDVPTLNKRDCQLFMKRLRKEYGEFKLRFFLAGEYGDKTKRPHYHCIIFGLSLGDIGDIVYFGKNELGDNYYISKKLERIWNKGFVLAADVSWKTCAYVARYVTKKVNGLLYDELYGSSGRVNCFSLMSRKPGIGALYLEKHPDCLDFNSINLSTSEGGLEIRIPKYYYKQLNRENSILYDPVKYDSISEQRKKYASDSMMLKLSQTDLSLVEYLENLEINKYAKIQYLHRKKVE